MASTKPFEEAARNKVPAGNDRVTVAKSHKIVTYTAATKHGKTESTFTFRFLVTLVSGRKSKL